jgi:diaminopimelate decarboxylase
MIDFPYNSGVLHCERVSMDRIAREVGTPVYVYSEASLFRQVQQFEEAFQQVPHLTCYAVKANSNLSILRLFAKWGTGFEIVSGGELFRVLRAGGSGRKIVFDGPGKTVDEIQAALRSDILFFNVESAAEADLIAEAARQAGTRARVSIRTNPDVDPRTHPYISTGMKEHKFGIPPAEAHDLYEKLRSRPEIELVGVTCHIGSQITALAPYEEALGSIRDFVSGLMEEGIQLRYLDFGGGLGISYNGEEAPSPASYASLVIEATRDLGLTLVLEPGRILVGNAGALVTRVTFTKKQGGKRFVIVDAGMNDLIRPALYGSYHQLWPVEQTSATETVDVVGPICESTDFIARDREVAVMERGDLVAVMSAGAYAFSLSSNYNSRPRVAEVLVSDDTYRVIRRRETYEDLVRLEEDR